MCNNSAMLQFVRSYWKTIVTAIFIAYLSLFKPNSTIQLPPIPFVDKWIHIVLYTTLTAVALLDTKTRKNNTSSFLLVLLISILYGGLMEILQQFFPPRTSSWYDFLANILGCLLAFGSITWFVKKKRNG